MNNPHTVIVHYRNRAVTTEPPTLQVQTGDTIQFQLAPEAPGGKLQITFDDAKFFSAPNFVVGQKAVTVLSAPDDGRRLTYQCRIEGAGDEFSSDKPGGDIEVDRGQGASR